MRSGSAARGPASWPRARRLSPTRSMRTLCGCALVCEYAFFVSDLLRRDFSELDVDDVVFVGRMDFIRTKRIHNRNVCAYGLALTDPRRRLVSWMRFRRW